MKAIEECAQEIIKSLLDKYERSKVSSPSKQITKRIFLNLEKRDFKAYDTSDYEIVSQYNQAVFQLAEQHLVQYEWVKHSRDLLAKVILDMDHLNEVYAYASRTPKLDKYQQAYEQIAGTLDRVKQLWIRDFLTNELAFLKRNAKVSSKLSNQEDELSDLLHILLFVDEGRMEAMRVMSVQLFHDSKYFEKHYKKKICDILKLHPDISTYLDITQNEILEYCGILPHQEVYEFCGPLHVLYEDNQLSFHMYHEGVMIKRKMALAFTQIDFHDIEQVTFIENYTNYEVYLEKERKEHELVIYHGGYSSPRKAEFFLLLEAALPMDIPCYFWADIDYGGFTMFVRLQKIFTKLLPMRMDTCAYLAKLPYARDVPSSNYLTKVQGLFDDRDYVMFHEVIKEIIKNEKVVEQESFLIL